MKYDDKPILLAYKDIFTKKECSEITGVLLCKSDINWVEYKIESLRNQWKMISVARNKLKFLRADPYPMDKNHDLVYIINLKLRDLFKELEKQDLIKVNIRLVNQWLCYLYDNGDDSSPMYLPDTIDSDKPIILIILGGTRHILIISKKTKKTILSHKVKEGMVFIILHPFEKNYVYQVPIEDCPRLHIQMNGSFIGSFS